MTRGTETWITELTPLSFLARSAGVYPDKTAIVHGAHALDLRRVRPRRPAAGAGPARVGGRAWGPRRLPAAERPGDAARALRRPARGCGARRGEHAALRRGGPLHPRPLRGDRPRRRLRPAVRGRPDPREPGDGPRDRRARRRGGAGRGRVGRGCDVRDLLARGDEGEDLPWSVDDERGTISINYTSGTTGKPKGVQYHHRGAYLNSLGEIIQSYHDPSTVYLWTLPMFHCNGWCTPWGITAIGGTHVCLREVRGDAIWAQIGEHRVTHLNGAPTVVTTIMNARRGPHPRLRPRGHDGGCAAQPDDDPRDGADGLPHRPRLRPHRDLRPVHGVPVAGRVGGLSDTERAKLQARQGVGMIQTDAVRVVEVLEGERRTGDGAADDDPDSVELVDVPADGTTMGEIVMHGNNVMSGYYRDPEATTKAFAGGWYHSGDLGVMHPDGYVELRDRAKDVIISGGENISTVEVEQAVLSHEAVLEAAVVGVPDERWGERPKAFVVLRQGTIGRARGDHRARQDGHRALQGAARGRGRRRAPQDLHRQDPEVRAARQGVGRAGAADPRAERVWRHGHESVTTDPVEPMGPLMSLPTDPFAAPSSGPIVLARAARRPAAARAAHADVGCSRPRRARSPSAPPSSGSTLGTVDAPDRSRRPRRRAGRRRRGHGGPARRRGADRAGDPDPAGGDARGPPRRPTPPRPRSRPTTRATADRADRAAALARAARLRERAWERAVERALVTRAGAVRAHGHGHGHHR